MKFYKYLNEDGSYSVGEVEVMWPLPYKNDDGTWEPGEWVPPTTGGAGVADVYSRDELECYKVVNSDGLFKNVGSRLFIAEISDCAAPLPRNIGYGNVPLCRLIREVESWNEVSARLFICDNAFHVLPIYEKFYPNDNRPRKAIELAKRLAEGDDIVSFKRHLPYLTNKVFLRAVKNASIAATEASLESNNLAAQYAALVAAMAAATDKHIAYYVSDAVEATQRAVYEYMYTQIVTDLKLFDIDENSATVITENITRMAYTAMNRLYNWQKNRFISELITT